MTLTEQTHLTPECLLAHPDFARARDAHIDAILDLYETRPALIELMLDGGRIMVYGILMALWGGYREEDEATAPTVSRLKQAVGLFGVASPRKIDMILARFLQVGHIGMMPAPHDMRRRILLPSPALIEHDRAFIRAHFTALGVLCGPEAYAGPLAGDTVVLKAIRGAWMETLDAMARDIFADNRPLQRFYAASAGMLMLMKLSRIEQRSGEAAVSLDYTDLGRRFGVSRTHVRTLFRSAAAEGDIEIDGGGNLRLGAGLRAAFDCNIAGRLALLDRAHAAVLAGVSR